MGDAPLKGSEFIEQAKRVERERKLAIQRHRERLVEFFEADVLYKPFDLPEIEAAVHEQREVGWTFSGNRGPVPTGDYAEVHIPDGLRISLSCLSKTCMGAQRTFVRSETPISVDTVVIGAAGNFTFACAHCGSTVAFLVHAKREGALCSLVKAGMWPTVRPRPEAAVARALGGQLEIYTKGMAAEKAGFGIGAYAYYRQVTEGVIGQLLGMLRRFAVGTGNEVLVKAIDSKAAEQQASKRIEAVKDLLPPMLREGRDDNPLGRIYGALSDHLHGRSDAECLALAADLRTSLEFLLGTLAQQEIAKERYVESMQKLGQQRPTKKS